MAGRDYKREDILTFGRHLLDSGDLDPVYIALSKAEFDEATLHRWMIAYWCFYHCGAASYMAQFEGNDFFKVMYTAAKNEELAPTGGRWPRGHERRHFRGEQGTSAVLALHKKYGGAPEDMVATILEAARANPSFEHVSRAVQEHRNFGPWIGFKVCDMVDRVLEQKVDFTEAAVFMFKDPVKAALMLWRLHHGYPESAMPKDQTAVIHQVVEHLKKEFQDYNAPPNQDRAVDLQEVETVLCKWKSHMNGHYPFFNDITEINDGLQDWLPHSEVARSFHHFMPKRG